MEMIQQLYANHPFVTILIGTTVISLVLLKLIALFGKIFFVASIGGILIYFFAISPVQQQELNTEAKKILVPIFGEMKKMNPISPSDVSKSVQERYNQIVSGEE